MAAAAVRQWGSAMPTSCTRSGNWARTTSRLHPGAMAAVSAWMRGSVAASEARAAAK